MFSGRGLQSNSGLTEVNKIFIADFMWTSLNFAKKYAWHWGQQELQGTFNMKQTELGFQLDHWPWWPNSQL